MNFNCYTRTVLCYKKKPTSQFCINHVPQIITAFFATLVVKSKKLCIKAGFGALMQYAITKKGDNHAVKKCVAQKARVKKDVTLKVATKKWLW